VREWFARNEPMPTQGRRRASSRVPATQGVRVGGRSGRVVVDVLRAAAAELAERGYHDFRIEQVASAAGVNKTTVYRRWPTKVDLVEATLRETAPHSKESPDTGSVEGDLLALLRREMQWHQTPTGAGIVRMLLHETGEPELERMTKAMHKETLRPWLSAIEKGKARGEIPSSCDPLLLLDMMLLPPMVRLHRQGETVDASTLATIVRIVVAGARSEGGARLRQRRK
jgi:AcrR family transcriptional regulator